MRNPVLKYINIIYPTRARILPKVYVKANFVGFPVSIPIKAPKESNYMKYPKITIL